MSCKYIKHLLKTQSYVVVLGTADHGSFIHGIRTFFCQGTKKIDCLPALGWG